MITATKAFTTSTGLICATLEAAQAQEMALVLGLDIDSPFVAIVFKNKDKVVDILTTTENSKPRARKINGGTKKRKASAPGADQLKTEADITKPFA